MHIQYAQIAGLIPGFHMAYYQPCNLDICRMDFYVHKTLFDYYTHMWISSVGQTYSIGREDVCPLIPFHIEEWGSQAFQLFSLSFKAIVEKQEITKASVLISFLMFSEFYLSLNLDSAEMLYNNSDLSPLQPLSILHLWYMSNPQRFSRDKNPPFL